MPVRITRTGQGSNSAQLRHFNERIVLQALRRLGEASKADLARAAGLTNNAVGGIIRDLEAQGLVRDVGKKREGQRGQPATMLTLDPTGAFAIGVRLDRVGIEVVRVDFGGRILAHRGHDRVLPAPDEVLELVLDDIESLLAEVPAGERGRLSGIGVAQPYNLGSWLRELELPSSSFKLWDDYDFALALGRATGQTVFAENDGNAAAIAELFYGKGRQIDDFLYVFIGGAIGGGLVMAGDCVHGVAGNAGDIAMMPVPGSRLASAPAPTRAFDVLLTRASLTALKRHLAWHGIAANSLKEVSAVLARRPRPQAVAEWIDDCVAALVPALMSVVSLIDMPHVVIDADVDGGLLDDLIEDLDRAIDLASPESVRRPLFFRGSFGPDAGALGAATLPLFFNFSPRSSILTGAAGSIRETTHAAE
ncbi:ROK family transcriptional regulator [Mongoliimonas terrestris]|uniref:ROK family transcriptional regulator n=1 Tax=Mongoliimonas terrestris TaxID=1709001 RepID=UPI000A688729|nr:ROK family transcriptional regulator [Mongoliimonas terrestris]